MPNTQGWMNLADSRFKKIKELQRENDRLRIESDRRLKLLRKVSRKRIREIRNSYHPVWGWHVFFRQVDEELNKEKDNAQRTPKS